MHISLIPIDELRWIEEIMGRKRELDKFAPRTLDIDLLLYGDLLLDDARGSLPHKQLLTQQFVYLPMLDIASDTPVPGLNVTLENAVTGFANPDLKIEPIPA